MDFTAAAAAVVVLSTTNQPKIERAMPVSQPRSKKKLYVVSLHAYEHVFVCVQYAMHAFGAVHSL